MFISENKNYISGAFNTIYLCFILAQKFNHMKKQTVIGTILATKNLFLLMLSLSVFTIACKKESSNTAASEYYVKYEVSSTTIYSGGKLNLGITNEKNSQSAITIATRAPYEVTIGPVKKGFNANLSVSKEGSPDNQLKLYTQISVSKDGGPFALKAINGSDSPRNSAQVSYTVE